MITNREPVRFAWIITAITQIIAVAVVYGLLSQDQAQAWITLAGVIPIVATGILNERARMRVTPTIDPRDDKGNKLGPI